MADPPAAAEPSQQAGGSRLGSSGRDPERARSSRARRKSIRSMRTGRGQSLAPGPPTDSHSGSGKDTNPTQAMDWEDTPDKGKSQANPTTPTLPMNYPMEEPAATPSSRSASARDPKTAFGGQHSQQPARSNLAASPSIRRGTISGTPGSRAPPAKEIGDSEEEVAPSPNLR